MAEPGSFQSPFLLAESRACILKQSCGGIGTVHTRMHKATADLILHFPNPMSFPTQPEGDFC